MLVDRHACCREFARSGIFCTQGNRMGLEFMASGKIRYDMIPAAKYPMIRNVRVSAWTLIMARFAGATLILSM